MPAPAPHVHSCQKCDPSLKASTVRQSEQHFGVKFGDRHLRVYLNGQEERGGYECLVGEDGWVLRFTLDETGKRHVCPNHRDNVCAERVAGSVRVEAMVPA